MTSNQDVANLFARGATKGRTKGMFIEGNTLYSCGHHFPLAQRKGNTMWVNTDKYSPTTSHHQSNVRNALIGFCNKEKIIEKKTSNFIRE